MKNIFKFVKHNPYVVLSIIIDIIVSGLFSGSGMMPLLVVTSACLITAGIIMDKDYRDLF